MSSSSGYTQLDKKFLGKSGFFKYMDELIGDFFSLCLSCSASLASCSEFFSPALAYSVGCIADSSSSQGALFSRTCSSTTT
jgi:hypothetical protein